MRKFLKMMVDYGLPGYMPNPDAPKWNQKYTVLCIVALNIGAMYLWVKDQTRDDVQGEFSWSDAKDFGNPYYERRNLHQARAHVLHLIDQMLESDFIDAATADLISTVIQNSKTTEDIDGFMQAFFNDLVVQLNKTLKRETPNTMPDPLGDALRSILNQAGIQTLEEERVEVFLTPEQQRDGVI